MNLIEFHSPDERAHPLLLNPDQINAITPHASEEDQTVIWTAAAPFTVKGNVQEVVEKIDRGLARAKETRITDGAMVRPGMVYSGDKEDAPSSEAYIKVAMSEVPNELKSSAFAALFCGYRNAALDRDMPQVYGGEFEARWMTAGAKLFHSDQNKR